MCAWYHSLTEFDSVEKIKLGLKESNDLLNVYALPVGQGDCTIIQCPNGNLVVVDCGSTGGYHRLQPIQIWKLLKNYYYVKAIVIPPRQLGVS